MRCQDRDLEDAGFFALLRNVVRAIPSFRAAFRAIPVEFFERGFQDVDILSVNFRLGALGLHRIEIEVKMLGLQKLSRRR